MFEYINKYHTRNNNEVKYVKIYIFRFVWDFEVILRFLKEVFIPNLICCPPLVLRIPICYNISMLHQYKQHFSNTNQFNSSMILTYMWHITNFRCHTFYIMIKEVLLSKIFYFWHIWLCIGKPWRYLPSFRGNNFFHLGTSSEEVWGMCAFRYLAG